MATPARAAPRTAARSSPVAGVRAHCEMDAAPVDDASSAGPHAAFLASLAHDLRTPLNAMVGWLHLLTSGHISEELRERALAGLQRAVEQQRRVVATLDAPSEFVDGYWTGRGARDAAQHRASATHDAERQRTGEARARDPEARKRDAEPRTRDAERAMRAPTRSSGIAPVDAAAVAHAAQNPAPGLLQGVFVLAVDDDPDVLQMLQSLLEHSGAIVESTTSPDEALRRYASWASGEGERLVLSDLAMHERDGISLMRALRALEREMNLRRLPAIALSAHFRPDTRRQAFEGGFDLFLAKPIDPSVLLNQLRSMLDR